MKITLLAIGKTDSDYLKQGIGIFENRLKHYLKFSINTIPDLKNRKSLSFETQRQQEGSLILKELQKTDDVVLLDEKGKTYTSADFSIMIDNKMITSTRHLVFIIGGPYGFSEEVYKRANSKFSLSGMTFSHQMVRLIFIEQLYRALTIIKGEPYHHQ